MQQMFNHWKQEWKFHLANTYEYILLLPPFHNVVHIDFLKSQTSQTLNQFIEKNIYILNVKPISLDSS